MADDGEVRLGGKVAIVVGAGADVLEKLTDKVLARELDPYSAADELMRRFGLNDA